MRISAVAQPRALFQVIVGTQSGTCDLRKLIAVRNVGKVEDERAAKRAPVLIFGSQLPFILGR